MYTATGTLDVEQRIAEYAPLVRRMAHHLAAKLPASVEIDDIVQARGTLPQIYVGLLTDPSGAATILASSTRHGRTMSIKVLRPIDVPAGKVLELWALPRDGEPFPLGVVPREGKAAVEMPDTSEKLLSNVPRLAVSIEDRAARRGDVPGGFILSGHCVKLW